MIPATIIDTFGLRNIGFIMGSQNIAWVLGGAIGPYVGGFIFDVTSDYFIAFLAGVVAMLIAAVLVSLIDNSKAQVL